MSHGPRSNCGHRQPHPPGSGAYQSWVALSDPSLAEREFHPGTSSAGGSDRWTAEPATTIEDGRMTTVYLIGGRLCWCFEAAMCR